MPVITTKVLTTNDQGLTELQKGQARKNIDAMKKVAGTEGNIVTVGRDGEVQDSRVSIHVFRDVQADWADDAPDSPHHIRNKPEQLLADARVEGDVLYIDKLNGGETVEFSGMSEQERQKLAGIEDNAQVNVIETVSVDGTPLVPAGKAVDIDLSGKVDKVEGKQLSTEDYTTAEKTKLGGIAEGAQVNVIETVQVAGASLEVTGKAVNIPYAGASVNGVVKLTDDPESVTENSAASPAAIRAALANFGGFMVVPLGQDGKPDVQNPSTKYIYLTKDEQSTEKDPYTEWIYIIPEQGEAHWDIIGEASVNLDNYVQKVEDAVEGNLASLTAGGSMDDSGISGTDVADAVDRKHSHDNKAVLDQVEEPYTTAEKNKLAGISNYVEGASVSGRTLTLTPKTGEAVTFSDTGDVNVIEGITVNGTAVEPDANKNVAIVIPKAVPDPSAQNQMLFSADGASWAPVTWEMEDVDVPEKTITVGGKEYKIVTIGTQQWMAENLAYLGTLSFPYYVNPTVGSAAYPHPSGTDITRFGYLYNSLALDYLQSVAPAGWHIPTVDDVNTLETYVAEHLASTGASSVADALKSAMTTDWDSLYVGHDVYSFKADAPGCYEGSRYSGTTSYRNYLTAVRFWCKFNDYTNTPYFGINSSTSNTLERNTNGYYLDFFSVRFVKNLT